MSAAFTLLGVAAPAALALALDAQPPTIWSGQRLYAKLEEYGEPKRWHRPVRTLLNSWSSLAFWALGVWILADTAAPAAPGAPANCAAEVPLFDQLHALVLMWTGLSSFLFHASLLEMWRLLDAGATMGAVVMPLAAALFRASRAAYAPTPAWPFLLAGAAAIRGCHALARSPGWSDIVLPCSILSVIAIDFGLLAPDRVRVDYVRACASVGCSLVGMLLRLSDMWLHRSGRVPLVWLGHTCWHLLMALAVLIAYWLFTGYEVDACVAGAAASRAARAW